MSTAPMGTVDNGRVIMVKKRLASGEPCRKCAQAEEMLRRRGLWERIDEVVWADEGDSSSPGWALATRHGIDTAPFFVVEGEAGARVYASALKLAKDGLAGGGQDAEPAASPGAPAPDLPGGGEALSDAKAGGEPESEVALAVRELTGASAERAMAWALSRYGDRCAIAFSGGEDVVLIDLAARTGLPFRVFCLDTGRLPPETYEHIEAVRERYGVAIDMVLPDPQPVRELVRKKGLFSFYRDGHHECCELRKVDPLERTLAGLRAWITGQRRDQSGATRAELAPVELDPRFRGEAGPLVKFNPLAAWTAEDVWREIHARGIPYNPLFERGYRSIGCAPCTRPVAPGQPDRAGRWWWEREDEKECGLHAAGDGGSH